MFSEVVFVFDLKTPVRGPRLSKPALAIPSNEHVRASRRPFETRTQTLPGHHADPFPQPRPAVATMGFWEERGGRISGAAKRG
eukprot:5463178-Pyramimonas_sp.AAC.1